MAIAPHDHAVTQALSALKVQLQAGVGLPRALQGAGSMCGPEARGLFRRAAEMAEANEDFAVIVEAFGPMLSLVERSMLASGWESGRIDAALDSVVARRELMRQTGRRVKSQMILPVVVLVAGALIAPLPGLLLGGSFIGYALSAGLPIAMLTGAVLVIRQMYLARQREHRDWSLTQPPAPVTGFDAALLGLPVVWRTERLRNLMEFCDLLGNLLLSGIALREALERTARAMPNGFYRRMVARMHRAVVDGRSLGQALHGPDARDLGGDPLEALTPQRLAARRLWPADLIASLDVADASGLLPETLLRKASEYREDYVTAVTWWGAILARGLYVCVSIFMVIKIFSLASAYVGLFK